MATTKRTVTVLALVFLILLSGCSASDLGGTESVRSNTGGDSGSKSSTTGSDAAETTSDVQSNAHAQQALIRTGFVRSQVTDFDAARTNLTQAVQSYGGFVSDSSEGVSGSEDRRWTSGRVVYRVPAKNFSTFFERVKQEGNVRRAKTNTTDVTDRVVDLEARLKNLRAQRDRLRKLYDQANDTESVLAVGERLSTVQGKIERLKAQRRALENQITYATVTVELNEPSPTREKPKQWYETGILDAFVSSVNGVIVAVRALFVGGAYATPYLIVFGLPLLGIITVLRRRRG